MALEALGGVTTLQNQTVQRVEPMRGNAGSTDAVAIAESMGKTVAKDTLAVVNTSGSNGGQNDTSSEEQAQYANEQIKHAVEKFHGNIGNSEVRFGIHEATQRVTIKIVDKNTKEIVKEFPPEKTLDMIAKAWELAGILMDEKR